MSSHDDELRPVTALFADVVGSTALAERLAPDEAKALIGECVNQMSRAVHEYGGSVQAYMGDGICAYFGVPTAREDDPERAARTALRILEVVREYALDVERAWGIEGFDVRVGINTGKVAVGLVGTVEAQTVAFGDTVNVAARLQASATPGTIAVGEEAADRLSHRFVLETLGKLPVRGRVQDVEVLRLVGPRHEEVEHAAIPIVGRSAEVGRLHDAVRELAAGRGQVLLLVGDAGIGKTRLLEELRSVVGDDAVWLEGRCLSYGGLPLWPFEEMLRAWLGIAEGEPDIAVRTKARARLGDVLGNRLPGALASLGRLLRVRLDPEPSPDATRDDSPETVRRAFLAWIEALARHTARRRRRRGRAVGVPRGPRARGAPARRDRSCGRPARCHDAARSGLGSSPAPGARIWRLRAQDGGAPPRAADRGRVGARSRGRSHPGSSTTRPSPRSSAAARETRSSSRSSCGCCSREGRCGVAARGR